MQGVGPAYQRQALRRPKQAVDGGIGQLPGARSLQVLPGGGAVELVQHAAMRHQNDLLAQVACRQFLQRQRNAGASTVDFIQGSIIQVQGVGPAHQR